MTSTISPDAFDDAMIMLQQSVQTIKGVSQSFSTAENSNTTVLNAVQKLTEEVSQLKRKVDSHLPDRSTQSQVQPPSLHIRVST